MSCTSYLMRFQIYRRWNVLKSTFISRIWLTKRICKGKKDRSWSSKQVTKFCVHSYGVSTTFIWNRLSGTIYQLIEISVFNDSTLFWRTIVRGGKVNKDANVEKKSLNTNLYWVYHREIYAFDFLLLSQYWTNDFDWVGVSLREASV